MKLSELGLNRKQSFVVGALLTAVAILVLTRMVIGPMLIALAIAYILNPLVDRLEALGISRRIQAWLLVFLGGAFCALTGWFLFPRLANQLHLLVQEIPQFRSYAESRWLPWASSFLHESVGSIWKEAKSLALKDIIPPSLLPNGEFLVSSLGRSTRAVGSIVIAIALTPFFTFFFIAREPEIIRRISALTPPDLRQAFLPVVQELDTTMRSVLRGQILVISLLSLLYSTAFVVVGMPLGLAVGVITGMMRLVPYMDIAVGGTLCFFILATNAGVTIPVIIGVLVSFAIIQLLDLLVITPRIVGRFSGIHPFVLVLAVFCFADWFGFFGALLAIPLTAVGRVLLKRLTLAYRSSNFFLTRESEREERREP